MTSPPAPRVRALPLPQVITAVTELHDRAGVPLTSHVTQLEAWGRWLRREITAVVVEDDDGRLVGAALLVVRARPTPFGPAATLELAGTGWCDHQAVVSEDSRTADLLADGILRLCSRHRLWRCDLEQLPADHPVTSSLRDRSPAAQRSPGDGAPQTTWPTERTCTTWASKKVRNKARGAVRKADASGVAWSLTHLNDTDDLVAALPATLRVRRERELALGRADALTGARQSLHEEVVERLARRGPADLWLLHLDGELSTYLLAVRDGDRVRLVDSRMRPGHEDLSPGMLVFGPALTGWHEDPTISGVDFGRGTSSFKGQFRTETLEYDHLTLWSHPWLRTADLGVSERSTAARERLRRLRDSSPRARSVVLAARRLQTSLRS